MRVHIPLLSTLLCCASLVHGAPQTSISVLWSDNFVAGKPFTDNSDATLAFGDVLQIGIFAGVDPNKDPGTYTAADWDSFLPLTGEGSLNPTAFGDSFVGSGAGFPPGFFSFGVVLFTDIHSGVPASAARIGIRVYDAATVAGATNYNTVTAPGPNWVLPTPGEGSETPTPPLASLDDADSGALGEGPLAWEGSPFKTDLVPGVVTPAITLTSVSLLNPTTLEIAWTGGGATSDIQTSSTGQSFSTVLSGQTSPATLPIDPGANPKLLIRVITP